MTQHKSTYCLRQCLSAVFMLLSLIWLTISLPLVNEARQGLPAAVVSVPDAPDEEGNNPFGNTTEEKTESGGSTLSEYLHDWYPANHSFPVVTNFEKCHPSNLYLAFHPDSFSPPPELAS